MSNFLIGAGCQLLMMLSPATWSERTLAGLGLAIVIVSVIREVKR